MKKSRKLFTALTALVLAVVGAIAAVTSVLAAQSQSVTSTLQVTYEATNVNATVAVASKTQSEASFSTPTSSQSHRFYPADGNASAATLTADTEALGGMVSSTFQRYAVYQFKFQNHYGDGGQTLQVTMTNGYSSGANVVVAYKVDTLASMPSLAPTTTDTTWALSSTDTTAGWATTLPAKFPVNANSTKYLYMVVAIVDTTLSITYNNTNISFELTKS